MSIASSACARSTPMWQALEAPLLTQHVRLTDPAQFVKAGEAYFSPDASWIIFQAVPVPPEGDEPSPHYSMYAAKLVRERGRIVGTSEPILLSQPGSANTCGWFHPTEPGLVLFGTTTTPPEDNTAPGYQRGTSRYQWMFPTEMEIVTAAIEPAARGGASVAVHGPMFERDGYDAEGSWSPCGRFVLYAAVDGERSQALGRPDADLWIFDTQTGAQTNIVEAAGYDGGPFYSPDGTWICYRSDRRGDNELQLFMAELSFDDDGAITGVAREIQLTDNRDVNWAPYFHPSGDALTFTSSHVGHTNYEVLMVGAEPDTPRDDRSMRRITFAAGFDGLSVFSPDGSHMMWTSQRTPSDAGADSQAGTSQVWIARVDPEADAQSMTGALDQQQAELIAIMRAGATSRNDVVAATRDSNAWLIELRSFALPAGFATVRVDWDGVATMVDERPDT